MPVLKLSRCTVYW